jgi:putative ABC transport system permease protein
VQEWHLLGRIKQNIAMLRTYFVTAFRTLVRNSSYALLNIIGLTVGMSLFLLIAQYVRFERSYEDFIPDRANIYRVSLETYANNELRAASAENYPGLGPALRTEMPGVTAFARLFNMGYINNVVITNEQAKGGPIGFKQHRFFYADSAFLPMMGYEMISGNASQALAEPLTAVISEKYARLYFGKEDPIGKTLHMHDDDSNDQLAKVTGVFKDLPANTHLKFDILFSYKTMFGAGNGTGSQANPNWARTRPQIYTYVRLQPGTGPKSIEARLPALFNAHEPQLLEENKSQTGHLQPLADIHLRSDLAEELETNANANIVFFLGVIGVFILLIAWINFVNLSTANAIGRAKEVGIRKVIGASRAHLVARFLAEAALINGVSLLIAWSMIYLSLPAFNHISGLALDTSCLLQRWFLALLAGLWIVGSLLSGFYPAWILSSFKPVTVLKGKPKNASGGILLRKGLVVTQFMASIALIAGTIIVYRQLSYMMNQGIGMNIDQVLVMDRPGIAPNHDKNVGAFRSGIDLFRDELKKDPSIEAVSNSSTIPGKQREYKATIKRLGTSSNDSITVRVNSMDFDFLKVFKMQLLAGRAFSKDFPKDPDTSAIITASAARLLGFKKPEDAIGQTIQAWDGYSPIIVGIVNDYHQVSLKKPLEPTLFTCDWYEGDYFSVRLHTGHLARTLQHVEQSWAKAFPGNPFEYFFLDDYFNRQYTNERQFGQLFTTFAFFAILISCLGLFGLSAYTASQRIKEIGIRKVLGASVTDITTMLSKDFLKLVVLAIFFASPLTWLIMNGWLQGFAYRINIHWWVFALAGSLAVIIALLTVSFQAIKAGVANPVDSLRAE